MPDDQKPYELPSHCFDCGVYLMGGATVHKPGCAILKIIEEAERYGETFKISD